MCGVEVLAVLAEEFTHTWLKLFPGVRD